MFCLYSSLTGPRLGPEPKDPGQIDLFPCLVIEFIVGLRPTLLYYVAAYLIMFTMLCRSFQQVAHRLHKVNVPVYIHLKVLRINSKQKTWHFTALGIL